MSFEGTAVAMITPFKDNKELDEEGFRSNINFLIDQGVDGLLAAGTTGESATLTHSEHKRLIEILIEEVDGRVVTLAGAGSNSTNEALDLVEFAEDTGADFALVITPYYNKPQQHGLIEHYKTINDNCDIPIIAYNVPSRTGVDLASETIVKIAEFDNIVALKEASDSVDKTSTTMVLLKEAGLEDKLNILSGDDGLTLPLLSIGAKGVISASANVDPKRMVDVVNNALDGNYEKAREIHYEMHSLIKALFMETSPAPTKAAYEMMNRPVGPLRQPLAPMLEENRKVLKEVMKNAGII